MVFTSHRKDEKEGEAFHRSRTSLVFPSDASVKAEGLKERTCSKVLRSQKGS